MFSVKGTYPAVGLFSEAHIIAVLAWATRKMSVKSYYKMLRVFAVLFTCLEVFKIIWSWSTGLKAINNWVPLYFCSLYIYALWFSWSKSRKLKSLGMSFIACACIVAGAVFIVFPTTSFSMFPIYHFNCIYSMVYHSAMVYSSIMLYVTKAYELNFKSVLKYCCFCLFFMFFAEAININFGSNLMFIANPGNIPLPFLKPIYNFSPVLFSAIIVVAHLLIGFVVFGITKLAKRIKSKRKQNKIEVIEIEEESLEEI